MRRHRAYPVLIASTLALSACVPNSDTSEKPETTASTPTAAAPTTTPQVSASAVLADAYCAPAEDGYAALVAYLEATDIKSAETGVEDDRGSVTTVNAAGLDMLAALDTVQVEWADARAALASEAEEGEKRTAVEAYDAFALYVEVFARPEAQLSAQVSSIAEYDLGALALLADPSVGQAATAGAEGIGTIIEYTSARCGLMGTS